MDWVKSNFYQRSQFVEYNGHRSLSEVIRCGVPRGSIIGPLFFIVYVNFGDASRLYCILFADDANLFISEKDPVPLNNVLNSELNKLSAWFATYKRLDHDKKKRLYYDFDIFINGEEVSETLLLGVLLDDCLS